MKTRVFTIGAIFFACLLSGVACATEGTGDVGAAKEFLAKLKAAAAEAEKADKTALQGSDGWLFFAPELRTLSVGQFWGESASKVSRAQSPDACDPLPVILDFKAQLDRAGITLIFVPVPGKAVVYPDKVKFTAGGLPTRCDLYHQEFYKLLASKGIKVLDLAPEFIKQREGDPLFCKQDTHWSGRACSITAKMISNEIKNMSWMKNVPKRKFELEKQNVQLTGDLWTYLGDSNLPKETVPLTFVRERTSGGLVPVESWRESPVLLLGDSHNLVFHAGDDMHAQGAGLADHLAAELGFPVDLVAVRGSGATPSRLNLFRRKDNLEGKKVVIWCLSIREFTEGQGWKKVPIIK